MLAKELHDLEGNIFDNETSSFVASDKPDTTALKLVKTEPGRNGTTDYKNPEVLLFFDDAIDSKQIKNAIEFADTSKNKINFNLSFIDDATISLIPEMQI